jgi:flagellar basal-body rod protein FlgC
MNLFRVLEVSATALEAERQRAEVVASNLANAETTRTPSGGPYQRQLVVFSPERPGTFADALHQSLADRSIRGVRVSSVIGDTAPPIRRYDPGHPDADAQGYVSYPSINPMAEMVDLMGASRAYALNVSAVQATKQMIQESISLLK